MENTWETHKTTDAAPARSVITIILAVLGFVAIIAIGMWGTIQIARSIPKAFSSLSGAVITSVSTTTNPTPTGTTLSNETITLSTASPTVNSGKSFVLSWTHANKSVGGSYTFRYDCTNGAYFTSQAPNGSEVSLYCNVPFNFINANNTIALTPHSKAIGSVSVPVYIDFTPNGALKPALSGRTILSIVGTDTTTTTGGGTTYQPGTGTSGTYPIGGTGTQVSDPNGYVDLRVRVVSSGIVDRTTGAFTPQAVPSRTQRVAVKFIIENIGTKTSPTFTFGATLPTSPVTTFTSPVESALAPGQPLELTLGFDGMSANGNSIFGITVDPSNLIAESDKSNNTLQYTITSTQ